MKKRSPTKNGKGAGQSLPLVVEQDEDGFYVVECPVLPGCYSQGTTLDEALKNIEEVVELLCEEKECQELLAHYVPRNVSFHFLTIHP